MGCRLVLGETFPILLTRLLEDLEARCTEYPLAAKWLLTPSAVLAHHLRTRVAQASSERPLAGVRILPLSVLGDRFSAAREGNLPEQWNSMLELLLFYACQRLPVHSPLGRLNSMDLGYRQLLPTLRDLAEAGFGPQRWEGLEEVAADPETGQVEAHVLKFFIHWSRLLQKSEIGWRPFSLQSALDGWNDLEHESILADSRTRPAAAYVYGFYDLTDINLQLLVRLSRKVPLTVYLPANKEIEDPIFSFSRPLIDDFASRVGTEMTIEQPDFSLSRTAAYFLASFPDGPVGEQPSFLSWQRAAGPKAEVVSAATRVRRWLDDPGFAPEEIVVTAPDLERYCELLLEVFADFAIPLRILESSQPEAPLTRSAKSFSRIWEDQAPAEWVLAHLREVPELVQRWQMDLNQFEKKLRKLPFWGGNGWSQLLDLPAPLHEYSSLPEWTAAEKELIGSIARTWGKPEQSEMTISQALELLKEVSTDWLPSEAPAQKLIQTLEHAVRFFPDEAVPVASFREVFRNQLEAEVHSDDQLNSRAVLAGSLMQVRGIRCQGLALLGLSNDRFPFRIDEDPLLSDHVRFRLASTAGSLGHRLSVSSLAGDEMALLFFLINTAADRIHWVIPETDRLGKSVAPTPYVQRYLQNWQRHGGRCRPARIPRGPAAQARMLLQLEPQHGSFLPPSLALVLRPGSDHSDFGPSHWDHLLKSQDKRSKDPRWNGYIPAAEALQLPLPSGEENGQKPPRFSVTALQSLCRCPYRFYSEAIARLGGLEILDFSEELPPLHGGGILHALLESLFAPAVDGRTPVVSWAKQLLDDEGLLKRRERLPAEVDSILRLWPPVLAEAFLDSVRHRIRKYLESLVESDTFLRGVPHAQEKTLRVPFPGLESIWISGKLDRVDREGENWKIYDYKSGRRPGVTLQQLRQEDRLGYRLQAVLYPWLFQRAEKRSETTSFSYVFLGGESPAEEAMSPQVEADEFLKGLAEVLQERAFFLTSNETLTSLTEIDHAAPCTWCDKTSLCRRFEPGMATASTRFFLNSCQLRTAYINEVGDAG